MVGVWPKPHLVVGSASTSPVCHVPLQEGERLTELTDKTSDDPAQRPLQNRVLPPKCATLAKAALVDCRGQGVSLSFHESKLQFQGG